MAQPGNPAFETRNMLFGSWPTNGMIDGQNMNADSVDTGWQWAVSGVGANANNQFLVVKDQQAGMHVLDSGCICENSAAPTPTQEGFSNKVINIEQISGDRQWAWALGGATATNLVSITSKQYTDTSSWADNR